MDYLQLATQYLEPKLKGKYIYLDTILPLLNSLNSDFEISRADVGKFVEMLKKKISESDAETCGCLPIDSLPPSNKE